MPRLSEVPRDETTGIVKAMYKMLFGDRDPVVDPGTATGTPGNWWTVFALHPKVFGHAVAGFQLYRDEESLLDPKLRELGQARAGFARESLFVFSQHCKAMRDAGFTEAQVEAVPSWTVSNEFSVLERAVLAYTDELVLSGGRVTDSVFEVLKIHMSDAAILELTYVTCMYEMHATMSRALRLEFDDVDERIVEIPGPHGNSLDVMNMVDKD